MLPFGFRKSTSEHRLDGHSLLASKASWCVEKHTALWENLGQSVGEGLEEEGLWLGFKENKGGDRVPQTLQGPLAQ